VSLLRQFVNMSLCIATLNVNGIADDTKRNAVFYLCRKKEIVIACKNLQKTYRSTDTDSKWKMNGGLQICGIII
jgi:hypothetical protein